MLLSKFGFEMSAFRFAPCHLAHMTEEEMVVSDGKDTRRVMVEKSVNGEYLRICRWAASGRL